MSNPDPRRGDEPDLDSDAELEVAEPGRAPSPTGDDEQTPGSEDARGSARP